MYAHTSYYDACNADEQRKDMRATFYQVAIKSGPKKTIGGEHNVKSISMFCWIIGTSISINMWLV